MRDVVAIGGNALPKDDAAEVPDHLREFATVVTDAALALDENKAESVAESKRSLAMRPFVSLKLFRAARDFGPRRPSGLATEYPNCAKRP
jgi:hypothetical protein